MIPDRAKYHPSISEFYSTIKKDEYVYYSCTGYKGPCELPRFREQEIAERMGHILGHITIPPEIAKSIEVVLRREHVEIRKQSIGEHTRLERQLKTLHERMDAAYEDKFSGTIPEELWRRKQADWQSEELRIGSMLSGPKEDTIDDRLLDAHRIIELAQNAHSLYLTREPA